MFTFPRNFSSSGTFLASIAPRRIEDMECDSVTFANRGIDVIWVQDAYDRRIDAFEVGPHGTCFCGGSGAAPPECTTDADCDDGNPCTDDECSSGTCGHYATLFGTPCSINNACHSVGTCSGTVCQPRKEICDNGIDDNCDGNIDCDDPQCFDSKCCTVDHYKCYKPAKRGTLNSGPGASTQGCLPGFCGGDSRTVTLEDQFEVRRTKVLKAIAFCTPVSKNGQALRDPVHHLTCYQIQDQCGSENVDFETESRNPTKPTGGGSKGAGRRCPSKSRTVTVDNQFESGAKLKLTQPEVLCVPSIKNGCTSFSGCGGGSTTSACDQATCSARCASPSAGCAPHCGEAGTPSVCVNIPPTKGGGGTCHTDADCPAANPVCVNTGAGCSNYGLCGARCPLGL